MFSDLKEQDLTKFDLIVSDGHIGIQSAAGRMFTGTSWQMCHVHFIRAVLIKVPQNYHTEIAEVFKETLTDPGKLPDYAPNSVNEDSPGRRIRFTGSITS